MKGHLKSCAFCGAAASTKDHVPSRKFFPPPRPNNLITVPACQPCNNLISEDEEYFLLRILASAGAATQEAENVSHQRFAGTLTSRRRASLKKLANETELTPVYSSGGVYLGHTPAYPLDLAKMRRVLVKIVRGLYFHEFGKRVPDGMTVVADIEPNRNTLSHPTAQALLRSASQIRGRTVFEYKRQAASDNPDAVLFFMLFFRGVLAVGGVIKEEHAAKLGTV